MSPQLTVHSQVPPENWDDDFEFNQGSVRNQDIDCSETRLSIASSRFTEDWDKDHDINDGNDPKRQIQTTNSILGDRKNFNHQNLPEAGPSTPTKRLFPSASTTENWDDDFEDRLESPVRRHRKSASATPRHAPASIHPLDAGPRKPPRTRTGSHVPSSRQWSARDTEPPENWDEEFDLNHHPRRSSEALPTTHRQSTYISSDSDTDQDDALHDAEFGFAEKEEDKTVTARSRKAALSRLTSHIDSTPPPPVPALPLSVAFTAPNTQLNINTLNLNYHPFTDQPFPRSPTASVFSVPATSTSGRDSVAGYSYSNSTTHLALRPSISRSSAGRAAGIFSHLPPSPPIHKERERRRLRKKSRPPRLEEGVFELVEREPTSRNIDKRYSSSSASLSGSNAPRVSFESQHSRHSQASIPHSGRPTSPNLPSHHPSPEPMSPPFATPGSVAKEKDKEGKPPLLSRIGSVKKRWAVRKKRASTAPSEVDLQEADTSLNGDIPSVSFHRARNLTSSLLDFEADHTHTPRPPSTLSRPQPDPTQLGTSSPSSRQSDGWFFRAVSAGGNITTNSVAVGSSQSSHILTSSHNSSTSNLRDRDLPLGGNAVSAGFLESPSKLVKRRSLGFVQLKKGNKDAASGTPSSISSNEAVQPGQPISLQPTARLAAYSGLGLGRAGGVTGGSPSAEDLAEKERQRKKSVSRAKEGEEKDKEGSRGFMGGMRRISLVGKHRKAKSSISLAATGEPAPVVSTDLVPTNAHSKFSEDATKEADNTGRKTSSQGNILLPPIELQPPSPPRLPDLPVSCSVPISLSSGIEALLSPSSSLPSVPASSSSSSPSPTNTIPTSPTRKSSASKVPGSPQSASLGRSTGVGISPTPNNGGGGNASVLRRNSLGDLKIPARISQAQVGLRRDLGMVREFAANIEQLRELQSAYNGLVAEIQNVLDAYARAHTHKPQPRPTSPSFFNIGKTRNRSNTNPTAAPPPPLLAYKQLASEFYTINSKYRIAWECAELLIELGSGSTGSSLAPPTTSVSAPAVSSGGEVKRNRERAITLAGDESRPPTPIPDATSSANGPPVASPPSASWRASTGRHDLSHRQLVLLKEMLNNADSSLVVEDVTISIPEETRLSPIMSVNRDWRWGDAMNSTITLPSEDNSATGSGESSKKKRRSSRLGMSGLRDMLKSLRRNHVDNSPVPPLPLSSTSLSTESSLDSRGRHRYDHPHIPTHGRRRAKTSTGPESMRSDRERERDNRPASPYSHSSLAVKASPRRPSLASIFRIGQKHKPPTSITPQSNSDLSMSTDDGVPPSQSHALGEEDDWDRIDSVSDLDAAAKALGIDGSSTVRGPRNRSPYLHEVHLASNSSSRLNSRPTTPKHTASGSHSSTWDSSHSASSVPPRPTRLSNVEEHGDDPHSRHQRSRTTSKSQPKHKPAASPSRPPSRGQRVPNPLPKTGSVRSMPAQSIVGNSDLPDPKLAMTPENIKPLLENAREVHTRLSECISEIRSLLAITTKS